MHSIVTTFRGAVIKVEVANFGAAIDTLIDQDGFPGDIVTMERVCAIVRCMWRKSLTQCKLSSPGTHCIVPYY